MMDMLNRVQISLSSLQMIKGTAISDAMAIPPSKHLILTEWLPKGSAGQISMSLQMSARLQEPVCSQAVMAFETECTARQEKGEYSFLIPKEAFLQRRSQLHGNYNGMAIKQHALENGTLGT